MSALKTVFRQSGLAVHVTKTKRVVIEHSPRKSTVLQQEDAEKLALSILEGLGYVRTHPNAGNVDIAIEGPSYHGQPTDPLP